MQLARENLDEFYFEVNEREYEGSDCKNYDQGLKEIGHYKNHPEMLPFIGAYYGKNKARVLLVGESHYLSSIDDKGEGDFENLNWYKSALTFNDTNNEFYKYFKNYTTRHVVNYYIYKGSHKGTNGMFSNPIRAYFLNNQSQKIDDKHKKLMHHFAFMNFYQRPAFRFGKSISPNDIDNTVAVDTLNGVIKVLEPEIVIFLSSKAYDAYCFWNKKPNNIDIDSNKFVRLSHPTSPWWGRITKNRETAKKRFYDILKEKWGEPNRFINNEE